MAQSTPTIGMNPRFALLNHTLTVDTMGEKFDYYVHVESDFYWVDAACLDAGIKALQIYPEVDYIRFEQLPFTEKDFWNFTRVKGRDILWRHPTGPFRFTFNPHVRRFKFINDAPFPEGPYTKQPEQIFNDEYRGQACCMTGDNFRHLGVYDEGGHYKPYYAERFFGKRGAQARAPMDFVDEFRNVTGNPLYLELFKTYMAKNMRAGQ